MADGKGSPLSDFYQFLEEEEMCINQLLSHSTDAALVPTVEAASIGDIEDLLLQMEAEASDVNSYISAAGKKVEENLISVFDADTEDTGNDNRNNESTPMIGPAAQNTMDTTGKVHENEVLMTNNDIIVEIAPVSEQQTVVVDESYNVSDIDTWTKIINLAKLYNTNNSNAISYDSNTISDNHISGTYYNNNKGIKILPVDKAYHINNRKIVFQQKNLYGVEMYIRPDIAEDQIMLLCEQVLLSSSGGVVKCVEKELGILPPQLKKEVSLMKVVEVNKANDASVVCNEVTVCIGVNQAKHRVLLALIRSDNLAPMEQVKLPVCITELFTALEDEELSVSYYFINHSSQPTITSIIDPCFIRDLVAASALDMIMTLTSLVEVQDSQVATIEKQCARMMTLLKPSYTRATIALPTPNVPKSINEYPLELQQTSVLDGNSIDIANLFILRARKQLKQSPHQPPSSSMDVVNSIITIIIRYIKDWCNEEALIRLNRKRLAVKERVLYIENFKKNLLYLLDTRSIPVDNASHNDTKFVTLLYEKCRVFELPSSGGLINPCLFDVNDVTYNSRKGQLYISAAYVYFHSPGGLFIGEEMKLIPVYIISNIVVIMHGSVCVIPKSWESTSSKSDDKSNSKLITTAINTMPVPLISSGASTSNNVTTTVTTDNSSVLCLELQGGVYEYFYINGPTPDYAHRLGDVINVLINSQFFEKSHVKSSSRKDAAVTDLLDLNYRDSGGGIPTSTTVLADTKIATAATAPIAEMTTNACNGSTTGQQPPTTSNTAAPTERKKLGNNIKAFLEQKQGKK